MSNSKIETIKAIYTKRFEISLLQGPSGLYYIKQVRDKKEYVSDSIRDLKIALYVFDAKVEELEGQ